MILHPPPPLNSLTSSEDYDLDKSNKMYNSKEVRVEKATSQKVSGMKESGFSHLSKD